MPEFPVSLSEAVTGISIESPDTIVNPSAGIPLMTGTIASGLETTGALNSDSKVPLLFGKVTVVLATYEPDCTVGTATVALPLLTVPV